LNNEHFDEYLEYCRTIIFPAPNHPKVTGQYEQEFLSVSRVLENPGNPSDGDLSNLPAKSIRNDVSTETADSRTETESPTPIFYNIYDPKDELGIYPSTYKSFLIMASRYLEYPLVVLEKLISNYERRLFGL
jgi:hypothetical protein